MFVSMHQPDYLPWLGYFNKIAVAEKFIFFDTAYYSRDGFHNRNRIKTAAGWAYLTIPLPHSELFKRLKDALLPADTRWARKHWRSLEINYRSAPYWQDYAGFFEDFYQGVGRLKTLADFNIALIEYFCLTFGLVAQLSRASDLKSNPELKSTEAILDVIKQVGATEFLAGPSGRKYIQRESFEAKNIRLLFQEYREPEHAQLFPPFIAGLSALDLLFNEGPKAINYLK